MLELDRILNGADQAREAASLRPSEARPTEAEAVSCAELPDVVSIEDETAPPRLQTDGLSNKSAAARGRMTPKYHLISDPLNDLVQEDGDIYRMGYLLKIIQEEWHNGNIKLMLDRGDLKADTVEPLHRKIFLEQPASDERWVKCYIVLKGRHETPYIQDDDLWYVMNKAAAAGIVPVEQMNNAETQPSQLDSAALSTQGETPSDATVARTVSLDELKIFVFGSGHQSERALWDAAKDAFPGKHVPRQKLRDAIEAIRGKPGRTGRPKKSPEETRQN